MRIAVDHIFTVDLAFPAPRIELALRVTPEDNHDQTVAGWRTGPDRDARLRTGRDGFGNVLTMLYAEGPLERMEIQVAGEVFTGPSCGILSAAHPEPLPPALFLRPVPAGDAPDLATHAIEAMGKADDAIDRLHLLNVALHERVEEVAAGQLAATFVAAARRLAFPARCVSGYLAGNDGGSAPHFWAEAFVSDIGWVGFDPMTGSSAGEDHARVASALDLAGVAAITGGAA